jgi:hypothetical protein
MLLGAADGAADGVLDGAADVSALSATEGGIDGTDHSTPEGVAAG